MHAQCAPKSEHMLTITVEPHLCSHTACIRLFTAFVASFANVVLSLSILTSRASASIPLPMLASQRLQLFLIACPQTDRRCPTASHRPVPVLCQHVRRQGHTGAPCGGGRGARPPQGAVCPTCREHVNTLAAGHSRSRRCAMIPCRITCSGTVALPCYTGAAATCSVER